MRPKSGFVNYLAIDNSQNRKQMKRPLNIYKMFNLTQYTDISLFTYPKKI